MNEKKFYICICEIHINIFTLQLTSIYQNTMKDSMTSFFEKNIADTNQQNQILKEYLSFYEDVAYLGQPCFLVCPKISSYL